MERISIVIFFISICLFGCSGKDYETGRVIRQPIRVSADTSYVLSYVLIMKNNNTLVNALVPEESYPVKKDEIVILKRLGTIVVINDFEITYYIEKIELSFSEFLLRLFLLVLALIICIICLPMPDDGYLPDIAGMAANSRNH